MSDKKFEENLRIDLRPRYLQMKDVLENFAKENYRELIKAIVSFEKGEQQENVLDKMVEYYMLEDDCQLLNEEMIARSAYEKGKNKS